MEIEEQEGEKNPIDDAFIQEDLFAVVRNKVQKLIEESAKVLVGQDELIELMTIAMVCNGHVLLEGVPGVAKTLAAKTFARCVNSGFSRIQFTPDLMPSDIIGTSVFNSKNANFDFKPGPVFSNIILIDEINRSPAKTQSALFEVMEEKQISYDGKTYQMEEPFMVIATQNPVEHEGTYRLPEAQLDRFLLKVIVNYPHPDDELNILKKFRGAPPKSELDHVHAILSPEEIKAIKVQIEKIGVSEQIMLYIVNLIKETRNNIDIYLGASPRASLALLRTSMALAMIQGRNFVVPDDVQFMAPHVLAHRIILTPEAEVMGKTNRDVLDSILHQIEVPR